ncbi:MAG: GNAT family N-acetyltransferase [Pseudomonadota bacterium]
MAITKNPRWATRADYVGLGEVMFDAVRNGPSRYNEAQRAAWTPAPRTGDEWNARLDGQAVAVIEVNDTIIGFMSLAPKGYVDFAYIRPAWQGKGVFRCLYQEIEARAIQSGETRLWTHASLMAEPAFSAIGFTIVRKEQVPLGGEMFARFEMEKALT